MKKKLLTLLTSLLLCLSFIINATSSDAYSSKSETIHFDDGSYIIVTVDDTTSYSRSTSKTGRKTYNYYNSSDQLQWYIRVIGTFTYNGSSATCTASDVEAKSYNSVWRLSKLSSSRSGSTAYASGTAKHYSNGSVINTMDKLISLKCSPTGTFS